MAWIYSIGHSNRSVEELLDLLDAFGIQLLVDVRRFPGSKHCPQFNQEPWAKTLQTHDIAYAHYEALGGRRGPGHRDSVNAGLRHKSFRNYADYMATESFAHAVNDMLRHADHRPTTMMCAEAVYWRCHRRLISDYLYGTRGIVVRHILGLNQYRDHRLTDTARPTQTGVTYPPPLGQT